MTATGYSEIGAMVRKLVEQEVARALSQLPAQFDLNAGLEAFDLPASKVEFTDAVDDRVDARIGYALESNDTLHAALQTAIAEYMDGREFTMVAR